MPSGRKPRDLSAAEVYVGMDIVMSGPGFPSEFITVSLRESRASIEGFPGQEFGKAVFFPGDEQFLIERDLTVHHYEVAGAE